MLREWDIFRTDVRTGELGLTPPDAVFLFDGFEPLRFALAALAFVHCKPVSLVERGWAEILVVASSDVTRGETGSTPDTPRRHFDLFAVFACLPLLLEITVRRFVGIEVGIDGLHLLVEMIHIDDEILDDLLVWKRFDADRFAEFGNLGFAAETLIAVDEEGIRAADRLATRVSERQ